MTNKKTKIEELKESYPGFFENYPFELIEFALSEKTAQKIANICIENKITEQEKVIGIAFRVTYAIFGKIPKESLAITFRDGLEIEDEKAKKIASTVNEIILSAIPDLKIEDSSSAEEKPEEEPEKPKEIPTKDPEGDVYREPIE